MYKKFIEEYSQYLNQMSNKNTNLVDNMSNICNIDYRI